MPELPEVTTTVSGINHLAKGLTIKDVTSDWHKLIRAGSFANFRKNITEKKIIEARRRGKNILIDLSGGKTLLIHLKMTGYVVYSKQEKFDKFVHLSFQLSNNHYLELSDVRKFAKVVLLDTDKINEYEFIKTLGPEPLDKATTEKVFAERLMKRPKWPIKKALTDQTLVAGIGNIYSDEILWEVGIHPLQKVADVDSKKMEAIYNSTKDTLKKSIELGGDSMSDYRNIHGGKGHYQEHHRAYRQTGKKCQKKGCDGTIIRIKFAGRGAHFCNTHQKLA